jgi:hypothetical protein
MSEIGGVVADPLQPGALRAWSPDERTQALAYLDPGLATEDLFAELGRQALGQGAMVDDLLSAGRTIYRNLMRELRGTICSDDRVKAYLSAENVQAADGLALLAVLASLVAPLASSLNAMLVAAITLRIGLREFCEAA